MDLASLRRKNWSCCMDGQDTKMKMSTRHIGSEIAVQKDEDKIHATSQLFLIRLWPDEEGLPQWRGKVQHVISGQANDFHDWPMLIARLQAMLPQMPEARPDSDADEIQ